jgi:hypothetical protein
MKPDTLREWAARIEDPQMLENSLPTDFDVVFDFARGERFVGCSPLLAAPYFGANKKPKPHRKAVRASRKQDRARRRAGR